MSLTQRINLIRTLPGRLFVLSGGLLLLLWGIRQATELPLIVDLFRKVVSLAFIASGVWLVTLLVLRNRTRVLWRVRRKLILSYVLLGFVPVVLIAAFALAGGVVLYENVTAYLFHEGFDDVVDEVHQVADTAAAELGRGTGSPQDVVDRKYANLLSRYPDLSIAIVPVSAVAPTAPVTVAPGKPAAESRKPTPSIAKAGPWRHVGAPIDVPAWVIAANGFKGTLAMTVPGIVAEDRLLIRSAVPTADGVSMVIVDLPVDTDVAARLHDKTGTRLGQISISPLEQDRADRAVPIVGTPQPVPPKGGIVLPAGGRLTLFRWTVAYMDFTDWNTGRPGRVAISVEAPFSRLWSRMAAVQSAQIVPNGEFDFFLFILVFLAALFTVIQGAALFFGGILARSITSAVHELFEGTERVRQGDFTHRISIESKDQLGELAESFNRMSASIEHLLHVQREKQRLDDELRIAREIQKSLLPLRPPTIAGLDLADLCEPAREVGGDYYDFFDLGPGQLGILIADVSGKGTSAALYMAELKGLMLALSHTEKSPRRLLIEVNHLLAEHLDNRSFITMTYAVVDLQAGTLTHARAGHTPLIVVSKGTSTLLAPDGMVLGLRLPGAGERFATMLEEHTQTIAPGDVVVFYTDGVTEAMDGRGELFGDESLARIVCSHDGLDAAGIRERVLREVKAFVGDAEPHDDMTMVVLKMTGEAA